MEERLIELELRYMELKRIVEDLSTVVVQHERSLERAHALLAATSARLRDLPTTEESSGREGDDKPPHY